MTTTWDKRDSINTSRSKRSGFTVWVDYLYGNNQGTFGIVQDENGENISIFADSGYMEIDGGTSRSGRSPI